MTRRIEIDGTVHEFPDDFTDQEIADALASESQPDPSAWKSLAIPANVAAPGAANVSGGPGPMQTFLRAVGKGAMLNFGDEIGGAVGGYVPALFSGRDPQAEYQRVRDRFRKQDDLEATINPKSAIAGNITGQVATGIGSTLATGGTSLPAMLALGTAQGGLSGLGENKTGTLPDMATDTAKGGAWGFGGALTGWAGGKILERLLNSGIKYDTIIRAVDGNTDDLMAQMQARGVSPAEADDILREVLRGQAAKNPTAAMAQIPAAQQRLADVGSQTIDDVNRVVSPENARLFTEQLKGEAQALADPGYGSAYANPGRVALTPDMMNAPSTQSAIAAAEAVAKENGRAFDPGSLTVEDLDAMQRFLRIRGNKAFEGDALENMLGPGISSRGRAINDIAGNMSPELAATQSAYAGKMQQIDAVKLGTTALDPKREIIDVAEEFANLPPAQQEAYKAGIATRLRSMLEAKSTKANPGLLFDKGGIIEKLKAVGFPEETLNDIIGRGSAARGVLDALQGGSDTARKLAAEKASQGAISKFGNNAAQDLTVSALLKSPWSMVLLPMLRNVGASQDRAVASGLINLLTDQSGAQLRGLLSTAPQVTTSPLLGLAGRAAGGYAAGR